MRAASVRLLREVGYVGVATCEYLVTGGDAFCFLEVNRSNASAVRLYRSLGFVVAGERQRYYSEASAGDTSALVMRLQLR